jgi:predicted flavoprotein YhiN
LLNGLNITNYKKCKQISKNKGKNEEFHRYSCLRFTNKDSIKLFGEYLYQGVQFGLNRKQQKFKEMFNLP